MIGLITAGIIAGLVAIMVAVLTMKVIKDWFRENTVVDKDNVRAIIQDDMANGHVKVIQVGFRRSAGKLTAVKAYDAEKVDEELKAKGKECIYKDAC